MLSVSVFLRPYEPCLVHLLVHVLLVLHPFWILYFFLPLFCRFLQILMEPLHLSLSLYNIWLLVSVYGCSVSSSYLLLEESSLIITGQGTSIWVEKNIFRNYFIDVSDMSCLAYSRSLEYLESHSWTSRQWMPVSLSCGLGLKLKQTSIGHSHNFCFTITQAHLAGRTIFNLRVLWLFFCPVFFS